MCFALAGSSKENTRAHFAGEYGLHLQRPRFACRRPLRWFPGDDSWTRVPCCVATRARCARSARHGQSDVVQGTETDHSLTHSTSATVAGSEQIAAGRGRPPPTKAGRPPPPPRCPPRARACALGLAPGGRARVPPARAARRVALRAGSAGPRTWTAVECPMIGLIILPRWPLPAAPPRSRAPIQSILPFRPSRRAPPPFLSSSAVAGASSPIPPLFPIPERRKAHTGTLLPATPRRAAPRAGGAALGSALGFPFSVRLCFQENACMDRAATNKKASELRAPDVCRRARRGRQEHAKHHYSIVLHAWSRASHAAVTARSEHAKLVRRVANVRGGGRRRRSTTHRRATRKG
jgi:hypothetical protein